LSEAASPSNAAAVALECERYTLPAQSSLHCGDTTPTRTMQIGWRQQLMRPPRALPDDSNDELLTASASLRLLAMAATTRPAHCRVMLAASLSDRSYKFPFAQWHFTSKFV